MTDNPTTPSSRIDVSAGRDLTVGGDVVGRDKIVIQNIAIVGEILAMANAPKYLSSTSHSSKFLSVDDAYSKIIAKQYKAREAQALSFAGEIIGYALSAWKSTSGSNPATFRLFMPGLAATVVEQLRTRGCWEATCSQWTSKRRTKGTQPRFEVFWLKATTELGAGALRRNERIGIAVQKVTSASPAMPIFVKEAYPPEPELPPGVAKTYVVGQTHELELLSLDFSVISNEVLQTILTGLVIDLAQVYLRVDEQNGFITDLAKRT